MWYLLADLWELAWRLIRATLGRLVVWIGSVWMRWVMRRPWWSP